VDTVRWYRQKTCEAADDQEWRTLSDGRRVPIGPKKSNGAVAGAAVAIVLAAVAGGGAGSAAAVSGAAEEFSAGARTFQSQEADEFSIRTRSSRSQAEARVRGSDDSVKATFRLRSLGQHPTTLNAEIHQ
jgi:outer membrane lipoprotein SlyB